MKFGLQNFQKCSLVLVVTRKNEGRILLFSNGLADEIDLLP